MALFGKKRPQQTVETTQSVAPSAVPVDPPAPAFEDPEDALRWKMVHSVASSLTELMDSYQQCFEKAEQVERAFGMADAEFVDGVRQHEISRKNFREMGIRWERQLEGLLGDLRAATIAAQSQWKDLLFLVPGTEADIIKVYDWCTSHGVDSEASSSIAGNTAFLHTDFGVTRESFLSENQRVIAVMERSGE
jgi:hypothetical protein